MVGRTLAGRYRLDEELGSGGMGTVYRAVDDTRGEAVAVKVLKMGTADPDVVARFRREQTFSSVSSPHLVRVLDHGDDEGVLFLVLELLRGQSLRERVTSDDPVPVKEALQIARDVACALAELHAIGVAHRDIKPGNIMLVQEPVPRAVVLDFGIARSLDPQATITSTSFIAGTAGYIAPEITMGGRSYDARADLYSLGVVLYEMVVGAPPFVAANALALAARQATEDPLPPRSREPSVPPDVSELVMRLLARNPAKRPASAARVAAKLEALLRGDLLTGSGEASAEELDDDDAVGPRLIDANQYYTIRFDPVTRVVSFTRTSEPFARSEDVGWGYSVAREAFSIAERANTCLLLDVRQAPLRSEPRFNKIVLAEVPALYAGWRKVATLVQSEAGLRQLDEVRRSAGVYGRSFLDEQAAYAWLLSDEP